MSFVVRSEGKRYGVPAPDLVPTQVNQQVETLAWDWPTYGWGILTGGLITVVVGGIILYFTFPYILAGARTIPVFNTIVKEAKRQGILT